MSKKNQVSTDASPPCLVIVKISGYTYLFSLLLAANVISSNHIIDALQHKSGAFSWGVYYVVEG